MIIPLQKFAPDHSFNINQIKRFGCIAYIKVQRKTGPKFRYEGRRVVLVGYKPTGYIFLKPEEGKYYESRDARFNEKLVYGDKYSKDSIKDWVTIFDEVDKNNWFVVFEKNADEHQAGITKTEGESKSKRGRPSKCIISEIKERESDILSQNQSGQPINNINFPDISQDLENRDKITLTDKNMQQNDDETNVDVDQEYHALLAKINRDPSSYKEAMQTPEKNRWLEAINDELDSMMKNEVWELVDRPTVMKNGKKPNIIDSRWVLKRKIEKDNKIRYKARLVIRGFKDKNIYDLRETYAPVSRLPLVRLVIAIINKYDLEVSQLDVKTAFLNGEIEEEIFMEIPEGTQHTDKDRQVKVCKLKRALYGLRISPKRWHERFAKAASKIGLISNDAEPCLFIWRDKHKFLILVLYVDDMLIASNDFNKLNNVKTKLQMEFEMTDLGEPRNFLGITIERDRQKQIIVLHQQTYIAKILRRFGFNEMHPQRSPMVTIQVANRERKLRESTYDCETLSKVLNVENAPYREAVGSLLYLANATRSDISYAVNVLSRHQLNPTEDDWKMVKRVFRYLKGTENQGLRFLAKRCDLQAFSDASFADCKGSLTTCGFVIQLFGDSIAWRTHKQSYVALSTCQAEYVAMSEACQEVVALNNSLKIILDKSFCPIQLWCDNKAAEASAKTNGGNKLRHMTEIREHYVKECVQRNLVKLGWIPSRDQIADIFTKPLSFELHRKLTSLILNETSTYNTN
ncbi:Retrovirus-related Pol polyprotein from transposon TNT 1-94 [Anthophora retusa]